MKVALLADIHGNHLALQSALADIRKEGIERLFIAGDYVGYYYHPEEVFSSLEEWPAEKVKGNHENFLLEVYEGNEELREVYKERLGSGIEVALKSLTSERIEEVKELEEKKEVNIDGLRILLCHGSPWDVDEYIYPDASRESLERFSREEYDIIVMGHTHHPMEKRIGDVILVNPGAIGQTRTRPIGAQWAVLDTDTRKVSFRVSEYDNEKVFSEAKRIDPHLPRLHRALRDPHGS